MWLFLHRINARNLVSKITHDTDTTIFHSKYHQILEA